MVAGNKYMHHLFALVPEQVLVQVQQICTLTSLMDHENESLLGLDDENVWEEEVLGDDIEQLCNLHKGQD